MVQFFIFVLVSSLIVTIPFGHLCYRFILRHCAEIKDAPTRSEQLKSAGWSTFIIAGTVVAYAIYKYHHA
jgi:hypothetical protein